MAAYSDDQQCLASGGSVDTLNVTEDRSGNDKGGAGGGASGPLVTPRAHARGPRDGRSLRDARGMWNVRDEQNLREGSLAGSFLAQCPGYVLKMLFGSLSVMDLCM